MTERWLDDIHDKLNALTAAPPSGTWERIEADMATRRIAAGVRHRLQLRRRRIAAAVAVVVALTATLTLYITHRHDDLPQLAATSIPDSTPKNVNVADPICISDANHTGNTARPFIASAQNTDITYTNEPTDSNVVAEPADTHNDTSPQPAARPSLYERTPETPQHARQHVNRTKTPVGHTGSRIAIGLAASNLQRSSQSLAGYAELSAGSMFPVMPPIYGNETDSQSPENYMCSILDLNRRNNTRSDITHNLPVKAALTVRYAITSRFGIESGLSYSYLSSRLTSGSHDNRYETRQHLHYIGVPVKADFTFWQHDRYSLYAAAGVIAEKCVSGHSITHYVVDGTTQPRSERSDVIDRPLQWSVSASIGAQASIGSRVGIYIEPGIGYYFNNGSPVQTIYKDKPLNFNINVGLRLNLGN